MSESACGWGGQSGSRLFGEVADTEKGVQGCCEAVCGTRPKGSGPMFNVTKDKDPLYGHNGGWGTEAPR